MGCDAYSYSSSVSTEIADKYAAKKLETRCAEYLAENFSELEADDSLLMKLKLSTWIELVKSDEVKVTKVHSPS